MVSDNEVSTLTRLYNKKAGKSGKMSTVDKQQMSEDHNLLPFTILIWDSQYVLMEQKRWEETQHYEDIEHIDTDFIKMLLILGLEEK